MHVECLLDRVGLNEREAPGEVATAKRFAQLRSVSYAPSLQICRSNGQKRQNLCDLAAYTSETFGCDHVRRFVFGY